MDRSNGLEIDTILLIEDEPTTGAWNMAVDDALLETPLTPGTAVLRLYRWSPACLSLGYFQSVQQRLSHLDSRELECVRRTSGGGAILHDQELPYSFLFSSDGLNATQIHALYDVFHDSLIRVLREMGIQATKCQNPTVIPAKEKPFLCFLRRSAGDVLLDDYKIVGSAQRRSREQVLQHGSILLQQSQWASELPGIFELSQVDLTSLQWVGNWLDLLNQEFHCKLSSYSLSHGQLKSAHKTESKKFLNPDWTNKR